MPMGIHWPDLDEDLGIAGMLQGRPAASGPLSSRPRSHSPPDGPSASHPHRRKKERGEGAHHTGSAIEYFTWLNAKLDSIEAMPSSRVSLVFRNVSYDDRSAATTRNR